MSVCPFWALGKVWVVRTLSTTVAVLGGGQAEAPRDDPGTEWGRSPVLLCLMGRTSHKPGVALPEWRLFYRTQSPGCATAAAEPPPLPSPMRDSTPIGTGWNLGVFTSTCLHFSGVGLDFLSI